MPRIQEIGPASTPMLFLENQNRSELQRISQQYETLQQQYRTQQIDYETAAKEIADMQAESDAQTEAFQSNMRMMQQSQKFVDLGIISPEESQDAMWAQVLPRELHEKMYPKESAGPQRAPFSPGQMSVHEELIEEFALSAGRAGKRRGAFKIDWLKKDVAPSLSAILEKYDSWKVNIGYSSMTFSQQGQVDNEWDTWIRNKGWKNWNPELEAIKTRRARGPLTRAFGSQFRGTPTGPREATNPLQDSIAADLSKRRKPEPKPKPEPEPRMWARNPKTKKRLFSDDGGRTWQAE